MWPMWGRGLPHGSPGAADTGLWTATTPTAVLFRNLRCTAKSLDLHRTRVDLRQSGAAGRKDRSQICVARHPPPYRSRCSARLAGSCRPVGSAARRHRLCRPPGGDVPTGDRRRPDRLDWERPSCPTEVRLGGAPISDLKSTLSNRAVGDTLTTRSHPDER